MPTYRVPNRGTFQTMTQPINVTIVNQILKFLNLEKRVKDIRYSDPNGDVRLPNTALGENRENFATFAGSSKVWVEVDSDIFKDNWVTSRPDEIDTRPVFADQALEVYMNPFMQSCVSTIKIRFTNHSYDITRQTREALCSRIAQLQDGIQHTACFSAELNPVLLALLNNIWINRETKGGYGDDFVPYLSKHSSERLITTSNGGGENLDLVFSYEMNRINGYFQVSEIPEKPTYQDSDKVWEFAIEYRVNYDIPSQMYITFPIMVHNEFLDLVWIKDLKRQLDTRDSSANLSRSQMASNLTEFGHAEGLNLRQDLFINTPDIDRFTPNITPSNTATVFISLLKYEPNSDQPLFNLSDMGTFFLDPDILEFFRKGEHAYLNRFASSFFYLHLYEGQRMMEGKDVMVDKDLNVWSTKPLDIRKIYRARFCLNADITTIRKEAFDRMWEYPNVLMKTLSSINEAIRDNTDFFDMAKAMNWAPWMISPFWMMFNGFKRPPQASLSFSQAAERVRLYDEAPDIANVEWGNGYTPPTRQKHTNLPEEFYVPAKILEQSALNNMGMRTVQIQNIIVHRKGN